MGRGGDRPSGCFQAFTTWPTRMSTRLMSGCCDCSAFASAAFGAAAFAGAVFFSLGGARGFSAAVAGGAAAAPVEDAAAEVEGGEVEEAAAGTSSSPTQV